MKTSRLAKGYLIFELAMILAFGYLLTPVNGANVFLLGPRTGLVVAFFALSLNPVIGIIGLVIAGQELYKKHRKALVFVLLVVSLCFATLFPVTLAERSVSHAFSSVLSSVLAR